MNGDRQGLRVLLWVTAAVTAMGLMASALFLLARNPYGDSVRPKNGLRTWVGNPTRSPPKAQRSRVDGLGTPTARELSWFASKTSPHLRRTSVLPFRGTPRSGDGRRSPRSWLMLTPAGHTAESWRPRISIPAEHTSSWAPRVSMPPHTDWMHSATCTHCFPETVLCEELRRVAAATLRCTGCSSPSLDVTPGPQELVRYTSRRWSTRSTTTSRRRSLIRYSTR